MWMPSLVVPPWTSANVALQRDEEPLPGALRVEPGENAGVGDEAQRRAVRGALVVVGDVLAPPCRDAIVVAQPLEQPPQLIGREQEEQHHRVGLLGELVAVRVVALGAQDPVQPLDVPVLRSVGVPVEFFEILVALELTDNAVAVERERTSAGSCPPTFAAPRRRGSASRAARRPARRQEREDLLRNVAQPGHHDVGVGVVAQPALLGIRVLRHGTRRAPSPRGSRSAPARG